jgi:hypothetical protein
VTSAGGKYVTMPHIGFMHAALGFAVFNMPVAWQCERRTARCKAAPMTDLGGDVIRIAELPFEARAVAGAGTLVIRRGKSLNRA